MGSKYQELMDQEVTFCEILGAEELVKIYDLIISFYMIRTCMTGWLCYFACTEDFSLFTLTCMFQVCECYVHL